MRRAVVYTDATTLQVEVHAVQRQVPADADGSWAELCPVLIHIRGEHDVLQSQARALTLGLQAHLDPAQPAAEFPCDVECSGRIATSDASAGVALELIAPPRAATLPRWAETSAGCARHW